MNWRDEDFVAAKDVESAPAKASASRLLLRLHRAAEANRPKSRSNRSGFKRVEESGLTVVPASAAVLGPTSLTDARC